FMSPAEPNPSSATPPEERDVGPLYEEVRRLARRLMRRERDDHTLQPTALANEAWLRLFGAEGTTFRSDEEFFAAAVTALRRVLIEHARMRGRQKRGGDRQRTAEEADQIAAPLPDERLLALDEALARLAAFDPEKAKLVELRFFGGLSVDEAAHILDLSPRTAARDWRVARAFLRSELGVEEDDDGLHA
ncbi:MAG: ECF-type sigma factor, partial [Planctomycetota bacterium]